METHEAWLNRITDGASVNSAALRAEISQGSLSRQLKTNTVPVESVIKLARAHGYNPVSALVDLGFITVKEVRGEVVVQEWRKLPDAELLAELLRRCDDKGALPTSIFDRPLDSDTIAEVLDYPDLDEIAAKHDEEPLEEGDLP